MAAITTNIGRGSTRYKLVTTDARDIPAAVAVWLHETARQHNVCAEAIAVFTGLAVHSGHAERCKLPLTRMANRVARGMYRVNQVCGLNKPARH